MEDNQGQENEKEREREREKKEISFLDHQPSSSISKAISSKN